MRYIPSYKTNGLKSPLLTIYQLYKARKEKRVIKATVVKKVTQVLKVNKASAVLKDLKVIEVTQVNRGQKAIRV